MRHRKGARDSETPALAENAGRQLPPQCRSFSVVIGAPESGLSLSFAFERHFDAVWDLAAIPARHGERRLLAEAGVRAFARLAQLINRYRAILDWRLSGFDRAERLLFHSRARDSEYCLLLSCL